MLRKLLILTVLMISLAGLAKSQTPATVRYDTDFQLWNDTQFIFPLTKKKDWNAVVWVFGRFGNDVRTTTDARIAGLITKKLNKYVSLGGGYLYRYSNPTFVRRRYESRYLGLATFTVPLGNKFTLVNRDQFQYEDRYLRPNAVVFRPKVTIKREIEVAKTKLEPFVSFEPFYDSRLKAIARYREQIGFHTNLARSFRLISIMSDRTRRATAPDRER